jgi:hypothetical protein
MAPRTIREAVAGVLLLFLLATYAEAWTPKKKSLPRPNRMPWPNTSSAI